MRKVAYHLVDVFTDRAFGGNPLAVFTAGQGLSAPTMQRLAKELNLSESTFVWPPQDPNNDFQVRIFTPAVELPMAGHPTIGTAFVLAQEQLIKAEGSQVTVRFEEGVGVIPVTLTFEESLPTSIEMRQPLPTFGARFTDVALLAEMLSLDVTALDESLPFEVISCGVPFLFIPLKSLTALQNIQFRREVWQRNLADFEASGILVFTQEVERAGSTVHCRMFGPALGVLEDPATGSASGPLGCYLVRYGLLTPAKVLEIVSEQGFEMGRPSFIRVRIEQEDGQITGVYVGGECYYMGQGFFILDDDQES